MGCLLGCSVHPVAICRSYGSVDSYNDNTAFSLTDYSRCRSPCDAVLVLSTCRFFATDSRDVSLKPSCIQTLIAWSAILGYCSVRLSLVQIFNWSVSMSFSNCRASECQYQINVQLFKRHLKTLFEYGCSALWLFLCTMYNTLTYLHLEA